MLQSEQVTQNKHALQQVIVSRDIAVEAGDIPDTITLVGRTIGVVDISVVRVGIVLPLFV